MNCWIVIPAYNEALTLASTIVDVKRHFENVVVVDDCSKDETGRIALESGAHLCRHPINLGQGAALATGIEYALSEKADVIVTFDADGQHSAVDAKRFISILTDSNVDVVLGSRFRGNTVGMPWSKRIFLKAAIWHSRLTTGLRLTDTHNGLRAFSRRAAETVRIRQDRMAHASEILEQIAAHRLPYVEAPCTVIYTEYSRAKGQRLSGAFNILLDLIIGKMHK